MVVVARRAEYPSPDVRESDLLADVVPIALIAADVEGSARFANQAWMSLSGQQGKSWRGDGWLSIFGPSEWTQQLLVALLSRVLAGDVYEADWDTVDAGDGVRVVHVIAALDASVGPTSGLVAVFVDVTAERTAAERLRYRATHDPLTGLYDRVQFLEFVEHALERQRRLPLRPAAVLFMDVDGLKATNDRLGHAAGDQLLRATAARIAAAVRPGDVVARFAGDEFTVLCEDVSSREEAIAIAKRVQAKATVPSNGHGSVSLSVGVAMADDSGLDPAALVDRADRAMYRTKHGDGAARPANPRSRPEEPRQTSEGLDVIAMAAHEMRTPLAAISGFATILHEQYAGMTPEQLETSFAALERQSDRLARLVDDVLDLGRWRHRVSPGRNRVRLLDAVDDALERVPPPAGTTVSTQPGPGGIEAGIDTDGDGLTRVFVNLLTNAYRYGGPNIVITTATEPGQAIVHVQDDGPGIPPERRLSVFEPFIGGGTEGQLQPGASGLGLTIAKQIVETCGGTLDLSEVSPHGVRMTIRLPMAERGSLSPG